MRPATAQPLRHIPLAGPPSPTRPDYRERSAPERRLMLAVLSDAVVVLAGRATPGRPASHRDVDAAARWLRSDDRAWPCSFVNVCEALGLAHQPLRRALLASMTRPRRRATRRRLLAGKTV